MEQILGKNCNQIFSGAPYRVQKDQGHLITSVFGIRGTVPGTKSSGALWILLTHPNSGHGRETQNIGWCLTNPILLHNLLEVIFQNSDSFLFVPLLFAFWTFQVCASVSSWHLLAFPWTPPDAPKLS